MTLWFRWGTTRWSLPYPRCDQEKEGARHPRDDGGFMSGPPHGLLTDSRHLTPAIGPNVEYPSHRLPTASGAAPFLYPNLRQLLPA